MITLCCDPGIRCLSFCVMSSNYEILLWDTYDILNSDDYHCEGVFKNGKVCGKKCNMKYRDTDNNYIYTCKRHFPKEIKKNKTNDFKKKKIDDYLLQDIATVFIQKLQELYETNEVFKSITNIFIELQPKCNPKMLFISHILYGKFIDLFNSSIPIKFVRASQKLRAYTGPYIKCNLKGKYAQRKWLGIKYGEWFLENKFSQEQREKWLPTLTGKLDDRFDVFLMSLNAISGIPKKQLKSRKGKCIK